jgi:hypothetical protein
MTAKWSIDGGGRFQNQQKENTSHEKESHKRKEASPQCQEARQGRSQQRKAGRKVKRLATRTNQAATVAKNGSNIRRAKRRNVSAVARRAAKW